MIWFLDSSSFFVNQCTEKLFTTCFHKFPNSEFLHILITSQREFCLISWFLLRRIIWLVENFEKKIGILEFVTLCGEHLKLNFKINDICCRSCSSSFCRLGCWGCNYNILLHFCILHPLKDSRDQISIPLIHYNTNFLFPLLQYWKSVFHFFEIPVDQNVHLFQVKNKILLENINFPKWSFNIRYSTTTFYRILNYIPISSYQHQNYLIPPIREDCDLD